MEKEKSRAKYVIQPRVIIKEKNQERRVRGGGEKEKFKTFRENNQSIIWSRQQ